MSGNGKSLEQRVNELERWRDQQITRDTVTVTRMDEQFDAVHTNLAEIRASIGDLGGRSVASRLISMGVDIGSLASRQDAMSVDIRSLASRQDAMSVDIRNLTSRQDAVESRLDSVETRLEGVETRLEGVDARLEGVDARLEGVDGRLETVASGVTEILQILRNP